MENAKPKHKKTCKHIKHVETQKNLRKKMQKFVQT